MKPLKIDHLKELEPNRIIQDFRMELANELGYIDEAVLLERLYHLGKDYYQDVEQNESTK